MRAYCEMFPDTAEDVLKGNIGLRELLKNGGLLQVDMPITESIPQQGIPRDELNAYTLTKLGGVSLRWTMDITEHLKYREEVDNVIITVFALPCILAKHSTIGLRYAFVLVRRIVCAAAEILGSTVVRSEYPRGCSSK